MSYPRWAELPMLQPRNRAASKAPESAPWYRVENSQADSLTVYMYGYVGDGWWAGENEPTTENLVKQIRDFNGSTLNVRLNSPGGMVFEGITIANAMRAHAATVNIFVDGLAASIASVIAVSGDRIVMMPGSQMMIHNAHGACFGEAEDMRKIANMLDKTTANIADQYAAKAGGEQKDWLALMNAETWYNAAEAVEAGLADEVGAGDAPADGAANRWTSDALAAYRFAGREQAPVPVLIERVSNTAPIVPAAVVPEPPASAGTEIDSEGIAEMLKGVFS